MEWSKLVSWEVQNFASIEHGICEFDETGIIFLKGYNDSGKSNMIRALDVLLFNSHPKSQVLFITDGKDYFRVTAKFSDGVYILRDKYINGQSLYEMYKDGECIFSTKVNGVLTKVDAVPEPIETYLGVSKELTVRTCYDKQFVVQTSGSENYRSMSTELRTEELVKAGELINVDKNKLGTDIVSKRNFLLVHQAMVESGENLTEELVSSMEFKDELIDKCGICSETLSGIDAVQSEIDSIHIYPELQTVNVEKLSLLESYIRTHEEVLKIPVLPELHEVSTVELDLLSTVYATNTAIDNIVVYPELNYIDDNGVSLLSSLLGIEDKLCSINVYPELSVMDTEQLYDIAKLVSLGVDDTAVQPEVGCVELSQLVDIMNILELEREIPDIDEFDKELDAINAEMNKLAHQVGDSVVICPECGHLITDAEVCSH